MSMTMALPVFLAGWVVMMGLMMIPSTAPTAILWTRTIGGTSWVRTARTTSFFGGCLIAWAAFGVLAWALVLLGDDLLRTSPRAAVWLGAGLFAAAGIYQLTPAKRACLRRCRSPVGRVVLYSGWNGATRDLRAGLREGGLCVACCWGLMIVLVAVGTMNVAAMVVLGVVVALEKLWRHGVGLARVTGVAFLLVAVLAPANPALLPALHAQPVQVHDHHDMTMGGEG